MNGRKVLGDGALAVAERIVSQIAQFTVFVVAARALGPAEFGVFALVSACAILLLRAAEVGWAPFIMSWAGDSTVPRQVLFVAILSGLGFGAVGFLAALGSGWAGVAPATVTLMQFFALWVVLANISSAQKGVMIWQDRLQSSMLCEIIGELVGMVVAIAALLMGYGVLSLAFGRLAMQMTHLSLSFLATRLSPLTGIRGQLLRDLWVFSSQIFVSRMLINIRVYIATFIVGGYLGPAAVGYYRAADRLVSAMAEIILVPGQLLAWSHFRQARDHGDAEGQGARLNAQVRRHLKVLLAAGAPLLLWLIFQNAALVDGLLSAEWAPAAPLVAILALARLLLIFGAVTEPLMTISGQARRLPMFTGGVFAGSLALTFLAAQFGLYAVAWTQVVISFGVLLATIWLFGRYAGIDWAGVASDLRSTVLPLSCGIGALIGLGHLVANRGLPSLAEALIVGLLAVPVYAIATALFDRRFWRQMAGLLTMRASA
ncbi:oligosaccharide flippase family protein [Pseudooceanicola sp.]|uniref:oligosaccharide flippase family protein n=1 Tax=Pseudooceanicola sp. TaxID=1914328 RepID=UPI0026273C6C|nr:oligosaccharide flippase family protein [Pseudooceanicola sp.]MDF1856197.1 oligosaccharide flippase family protein [Pseudooceanicola sp.]